MHIIRQFGFLFRTDVLFVRFIIVLDAKNYTTTGRFRMYVKQSTYIYVYMYRFIFMKFQISIVKSI